MMGAAGLTSGRQVRGRVRHETWWTIYLYTYLAIALAFGHQITVGGPFLSGWLRLLWVALYVVVFGAILWNRVAVPLWRSKFHDLRVHRVVGESLDVVSVWMTGRHLDRLGALPGQYFTWRFRYPGLVYSAHPYSLSKLPWAGMVRITVKALGDASRDLATVPPGTEVAFEGPYDAMTPARVTSSRVVLVAGGVGIAPIRTLADCFAGLVPLDIIYRASTPHDFALGHELEALEASGTAHVHLLAGSRRDHPLGPSHLDIFTL